MKNNILLYILMASFLSVIGCSKTVQNTAESMQNTVPKTDVYPYFVTASGSPLTGKQLADALAGSSYILVGETHNQVCDHQAQALLLDVLVKNTIKPVLGLEMYSVDMQNILDIFNELTQKNDFLKKLTLEETAILLQWKKAWGFSYAIYAPVFSSASKHSLIIQAVNAPRMFVKRIRQQEFTAEFLAKHPFLPPEVIMPLPEQLDDLAEIFRQYGDVMTQAGVKQSDMPQKNLAQQKPPHNPSQNLSVTTVADTTVLFKNMPLEQIQQLPMFKGFVRAQSLWDTTMAYSAFNKYRTMQVEEPMVILAGGQHVRAGYGIAYRLALYDPEATIRLIMPVRVDKLQELGNGVQITLDTQKVQEADIYFVCPVPSKSAN